MQLKFLKNKFVLLIFLIIAIFLTFLFIYNSFFKPIYITEIDGIKIRFRANLREANKIFSEKEKIENLIWNEKLKNITIVFVNSTQNGLVQVQAFEIAFKLALAYQLKNKNVEIKGKEVFSYSKLKGSEENILIALIPPIFANQTKVWVKDYVIFVEAKNPKEFDLATIKFLIDALKIKI